MAQRLKIVLPATILKFKIILSMVDDYKIRRMKKWELKQIQEKPLIVWNKILKLKGSGNK